VKSLYPYIIIILLIFFGFYLIFERVRIFVFQLTKSIVIEDWLRKLIPTSVSLLIVLFTYLWIKSPQTQGQESQFSQPTTNIPSGSMPTPEPGRLPKVSQQEQGRSEKILTTSNEIAKPYTAEPETALPILRPCIIDQNTGQPVKGAHIKIGTKESISDDKGAFALKASSGKDQDDFIQIRHTDYEPLFLTLTDPILASSANIKVQKRKRLIVLEFEYSGSTNSIRGSIRTIRNSIESRLTNCQEIVLLAEAKRDQIVERLYKYQEDRALYDSGTLAKVGNFLGATHGVFGSISELEDGIILECKLIDLESARMIESARVLLDKGNAWERSLFDKGSSYLADLLISKLTRVIILYPEPGTLSSRQIAVKGYALYLPVRWTLWITILPEGINSKHYPQKRVTVSDSGQWVAPSVSVGEINISIKQQRFNIYAVMTDEEYTKRFDAYLSRGENEGIDLGETRNNHYRILEHVYVIRSSER
jgi:hypothetical protein